MNLRIERITRKSKDFYKIKRLYIQAFPKGERMSIWLLLALAKRKDVAFLAFYDNAMFCGIAFVMSDEEMAYVLYLAIDEAIRSQGYGTKILEAIKHENADKNIVLDIETVSEMFENYSQRVKRQKFYYRNGFTDTGYHLVENEIVYDILSSKEGFSPEACRKLFRKVSFGLARPAVRKR